MSADTITSESPPSPPTGSPSAKRWAWSIPVLIILAGAAVRVYGIQNESVWMDEIACVKHLSASTLPAFIHLERCDDPPMVPAYFTLAYLWGKTFGPTILSVRLLSVLLSILSMVLLYRLARDMYGELAAAVALYCFAASPIHVYFAQEIRMYEFALCLALLSALGLRSVFHSDSRAGWIVLTASSVALMWTHLFAVFLLFVEGLILLAFRRPRTRGFLAWFGVCAASFAGLLGWLATVDKANLARLSAWIPGPSAQACHDMALYGCGIPIGSWPQYRQYDHSSFAVLALAGAIYLGQRVLRANAQSGPEESASAKRDYVLLILWWIAPPVLLALVSVLVKPSFVPRYVLYNTLAAFILIGGATAALRSRDLRAVAIALVVLLYGAMAVTNTNTLPMRGNWQAAADSLQSSNHSNDPIYHVRATALSPIAINYYMVAQGRNAHEFGDVGQLWTAVQDRARLGHGTWVVFGENGNDYAKEQCFSELLGAHPTKHSLITCPSARGVIWLYHFPGAA